MKTVLFTDLDATLLDPRTYSWASANEALEALKERGVSIVLVSSKTVAEIELIHSKLALDDPFIVENGGGIIFHSRSHLVFEFLSFKAPATVSRQGELYKISLGAGYEYLVRRLNEISMETGIHIKGFSDMPVEEVAAITGMEMEAARLAKLRDFDEPFVIMDKSPGLAEAVENACKNRGLTAVQGGRFWHLMGHSGKGLAVGLLIEAYRAVHGAINTVGLGDSPNDYPFLERVDIPVLLGAATGEIILPESLTSARTTMEIGPRGWNGAVLALISEQLI